MIALELAPAQRLTEALRIMFVLQIYERAAIINWIITKANDPVNHRQHASLTDVIPCTEMATLVADFMAEFGSDGGDEAPNAG